MQVAGDEGQLVLVLLHPVEDLQREVVALLRSLGAEVVGVGSIVDRSNGASDVFDVPYRALIAVEANVWTPDEDPLAKDGSVPVKPGSRALSQARSGS